MMSLSGGPNQNVCECVFIVICWAKVCAHIQFVNMDIYKYIDTKYTQSKIRIICLEYWQHMCSAECIVIYCGAFCLLARLKLLGESGSIRVINGQYSLYFVTVYLIGLAFRGSGVNYSV